MPKYPDVDWRPEQPIGIGELRQRLIENAMLCRNPASRFSFIRQGETSVWLFVDGECFECEGEKITFAEQLCAEDRFRAGAFGNDDAAVALIATLFNQGSLAFALDD